MAEESKIESSEEESAVVDLKLDDKSSEQATEKTKVVKLKKARKSFINSAWFPLLGFLLYGGSFMLVYSNLNPVAKDITNATILKIFTDYSIYVGWVLGLLSLIVMYVLYLIKKIIRLGWLSLLNPIILIVSILPWFFMARQLVYFEKRYIDIAKGLITYLGEPLLQTSYIIFTVAGVWFLVEVVRLIIKIIKKK